MNEVCRGLYYSHEHDWVRVDGSKAYIGITDYAQQSLGDIVFADGEPVGTGVSAGDTLGVVESVKAASDILAPISGTISDVNQAVIDNPSLLNEDPYESWLVCVDMIKPDEVRSLLDADGYTEYCDTL